MTVKERLQQLVESISDDQAESTLRLLGADLAEDTDGTPTIGRYRRGSAPTAAQVTS